MHPSPLSRLRATLAALACTPALATAAPQEPALTAGPAARTALPRFIEDGGAGNAVPIEVLDEEIPLPFAARVRAGATGDELLAPAAGDPFFLGFAAGPYHPPAAERWDAAWLESMLHREADRRLPDEVYGFVMLQKRLTPRRRAELEQLGARFLGFHPHYTWKAAIPVSELVTLAHHPDVRWIGPARAWQKIHPALAGTLATAKDNDVLDLWIDVFESDLGPNAVRVPGQITGFFSADPGAQPVAVANAEALQRATMTIRSSGGWQQAALEELGLLVEEYVEEIRAFRVRATRAQVERAVARDFVLFVEPRNKSRLFHDETAPMISADALRPLFHGNYSSAAQAAVIDSGVLYSHEALNGHFVTGLITQLGANYLNDGCGHGSHVAGTIFGRPPAARSSYAGMVPNLGWGPNGRIRIAKVFDDSCNDVGSGAVEVYQYMRLPVDQGPQGITPKPHVINCSYGAAPSGSPWFGTEAFSRFMDGEVFNEQILYVFAAGNSGPGRSTLADPAVAKNVLTVGAVTSLADASRPVIGEIAPFSSRGPAGDGRWKPNLVAPGNVVRSVDARGRMTTDPGTTAVARVPDYLDAPGTSMAAPHVAGVALMAVDGFSWFRYEPARFAAHAMATADHRGVTFLGTPLDPFLSEYGAGRINAQKFHMQGSWTSANWAQVIDASFGYCGDFSVPAGAAELVVVFTYHEPAASAGASRALVSNWDLWIDREPFDLGCNSGEYSSHQSAIDNTEIRIIPNPPAGNYRWKLYPTSATGAARSSVSILVVPGSSTSTNLQVATQASTTVVRPGQPFTLDASVTVNGYHASAVELDIQGGTAVTVSSATTTRFDQSVAELATNAQGGRGLVLGNFDSGNTRAVRYGLSLGTEGVHQVGVSARAENANATVSTVPVICDNTPPTGVTNLTSPTHPVSTWVRNTNAQFTWTAATDALSGLQGYGIGTNGVAQCSVMLGPVTSHSVTLPSGSYIFAIRALDNAGNCGSFSSRSFLIDVDPPQSFSITGSSHAVGSWSSDPTVDVSWSPSIDNHSGWGGYCYVWDHQSTTTANGAVNLPNPVFNHTFTLTESAQPWYLHMALRDAAGNFTPTAHYGPIYVDTSAPSPTVILAQGIPVWSFDNLRIDVPVTEPQAPLTQMRFRNDGGNWSPWQSYAAITPNWFLTAFGGLQTTGTRTVWAEVQNAAGIVGAASDSIYRWVPTTPFGRPCTGGSPVFSISGIPGVGRPVTINTTPNGASLLSVYLGLSTTTWQGLPLPLDLAVFGFAGCYVNISLDLPIYTGPVVSLPFTIPNDPSLGGVQLAFQGLLLGTPGRTLVTTVGLQMTISGV